MKPGIKRIIGGALVILLGIAASGLIIIRDVIDLANSPAPKFVVPGETTIHVAEPGRYYLWDNFQTMHEGIAYRHEDQLPHGLSIQVHDAQGAGIEMHPDSSISMSGMDYAKRSIAHVDISRPGPVTIKVGGIEQARVFSWSDYNAIAFIIRIFSAIGLGLLGSMAGTGLVIWGVYRLSQGHRAPREVP